MGSILFHGQEAFYGRVVTAAATARLGFRRIPYYNMPFFTTMRSRRAGWIRMVRDQITLGFPLAALFTLWPGAGHLISPRKLLLIGTALTAAAFRFSRMSGDITIYYVRWFIYTVGYIFFGSDSHQVIISQWFRRARPRHGSTGVWHGSGPYSWSPDRIVTSRRWRCSVTDGFMAARAVHRPRSPAEKGLYPDTDRRCWVPCCAAYMRSMLKTSAFWCW